MVRATRFPALVRTTQVSIGTELFIHDARHKTPQWSNALEPKQRRPPLLEFISIYGVLWATS